MKSIKKYFFVFFYIIFFSANVKSQILIKNEFRLYIPLDSLKISCKDKFDFLFNSADLIKAMNCRIDTTDFVIGFDNAKRIIFYGCKDHNFFINNVKYLSYNKPFLDSLKLSGKIIYELGWGAYLKLPEGWNLGFDVNDIVFENGKNSLKKDALPCLLFKKGINKYKKNEEPKEWKDYKSYDILPKANYKSIPN